MLRQPGSRLRTVVAGEVVGDDEDVARRIVGFDVSQQANVVQRRGQHKLFSRRFSMIKEESVPNRQLRRARLLKGWTQSQLAEELETDFETVSRWERGINVPSFYFQRKLSDLFGKSAEELRFLADGNDELPAVALPGVFLAASYADTGHELVTCLKAELQGRGIPLTTSRTFRKLDGQQKRKALQEALRAAQVVLLLVSPQARTSRHIQEALQIAKIYKRDLYAIWIAGDDFQECLPQSCQALAATFDGRQGCTPALLQSLVEVWERTRPGDSATGAPVSVSNDSPEPRNPYKGLKTFRHEDRDDFFGRDRLIEALVTELNMALSTDQPKTKSARLLTVVGASGSGKSSVVLAGLLPRLQAGGLAGSQEWVYLEPMVPGTHPINALVETLAEQLPDMSQQELCAALDDDATNGLHLLATLIAVRPETKVVLCIDQFEEVFTQTASEEEREHFLDLVVTAASEPHGQLVIIVTLRSDFEDRPMHYPALHALLERHRVPVLPMEVSELRAAIEEPAMRPGVRLTFEGDLVGDLLFEVQGQQAALPLLQFTLDLLFQRRQGHQLTLQAYRQIGGVKGALAQQAERTYISLPSEEHRGLARTLFLRLIDPGETEQDTTRRRAWLSELQLCDPKKTFLLSQVVEGFTRARLLLIDTRAGLATIEVSHEALIGEWERLGEWLHEAREDIRFQQRVSRDAQEWKGHARSADRLYRGTALAEARACLKRSTPSQDEVAFLEACIKAERKAHLQRRTLVALLPLFLISLLLGALLLQTRLLQTLPVSVSNLNDDGAGSLREAIQTAKPGSAITFATNLKGTIKLTRELEVSKNLTISGPGASVLTLSGQNQHRVFHVLNGALVTISNLTVTEGFAPGCPTACDASGHSQLNFGADDDGRAGGAIFNGRGTSLTLTNVIVSKSRAGYGGGIFNNGILTLSESRVSDNAASGIVNLATLALTDSLVWGNTNTYGGGINNWGELTLLNSTLAANTATQGGGIYNLGTASLGNSTLSRNQAAQGGGIYNTCDLTLFYGTIAQNQAMAAGGGIAVGYASSDCHASIPSTTLNASLVASNAAERGPDILGPVLLRFPNLIQNIAGTHITYACENASALVCGKASIFAQSPRLGPLQNNGGLTPTYALLAGSPALDRIPPDRSDQRTYTSSLCDNTYNSFNSSIDQRGVKRPQGRACDLGAYEREASELRSQRLRGRG